MSSRPLQVEEESPPAEDLAEADSEVNSSSGAPEEVAPEEADSTANAETVSAGPRREPTDGVPCSAVSSPARGRATRGKSHPTQLRFTQTSGGQSGLCRELLFAQNSPPASPSIGHGSNCGPLACRTIRGAKLKRETDPSSDTAGVSCATLTSSSRRPFR